MENQETKISNVTTSMKVEKEINGFKVSGTVEVYNDSKRIKRIDASVQKTDSNAMAPFKYSFTVTRGLNDMVNPSEENEPERDRALTAGIEFEKAVEQAVSGMIFNTIVK